MYFLTDGLLLGASLYVGMEVLGQRLKAAGLRGLRPALQVNYEEQRKDVRVCFLPFFAAQLQGAEAWSD
jgi:hypothetical protein